MSPLRVVTETISVFMMVAVAGIVSSQEFPSKPIRIITGSAGGGSDFNAREAGKALSVLGQPVVVENRSSLLVGEIGAKNPPDGYTLTVHGASLWIGLLLQKFNYDVDRDFAPVSLLSREVMMLAVHPSVPVKSVKELIALAKARPDELNYASSVPGGPSMLGLEMWRAISPVKLLVVPYKGTPQSITAVLGGESHMTIGDLGLIVPQAKAGKLRALAITSIDASALAPGMPTMAESGLPGYDVTGATAIWTNAKTPPAIINRMNQEIVRYLNRPDTKERFLAIIMEVVASSPEQLAARYKSDMVKWGKIFKDAGIKPQGA